MLLTAIYVIEILAIIQCIYCVYGVKLRMNLSVTALTLAVLFVVRLTNKYGAVVENSIIMYGLFILYCTVTFQKGLKDTVISTALFMTVSIIVQFISQYIILCIFHEETLERTLFAAVLSLFFCGFLLPRFELHKIKTLALKNDVIFCIALGYILLLAGLILMQTKVLGAIKVELFLFSSPAILLVLLVCRKRTEEWTSREETEKEIQLYKADKEKFGGFVNDVRLKQHELKNHLMALSAMHYTKTTYEELVSAQEAYSRQLLLENKYHSLLRLYNSVLPGFLYDKFKAMELRGVEIDCRVFVQTYAAVIPEYYLVQMLGILLDNAADAALAQTDHRIRFEIAEYETEYVYIVRNRHSYVPFEEISSWFSLGKSSKGKDRGIGLYHLQGTCQDWGCQIGCRNVSIDDENWIEFRLGTGRKA